MLGFPLLSCLPWDSLHGRLGVQHQWSVTPFNSTLSSLSYDTHPTLQKSSHHCEPRATKCSLCIQQESVALHTSPAASSVILTFDFLIHSTSFPPQSSSNMKRGGVLWPVTEPFQQVIWQLVLLWQDFQNWQGIKTINLILLWMYLTVFITYMPLFFECAWLFSPTLPCSLNILDCSYHQHSLVLWIYLTVLITNTPSFFEYTWLFSSQTLPCSMNVLDCSYHQHSLVLWMFLTVLITNTPLFF